MIKNTFSLHMLLSTINIYTNLELITVQLYLDRPRYTKLWVRTEAMNYFDAFIKARIKNCN